MGTTTIPLTTLPANAVVDDSVVSAMKQAVGTFVSFHLTVARNVGANPLDGLPAGSTAMQLVGEWSADGGTTWNPGISAACPGGAVFADKAQTIRVETFEIDWPFKSNFPAATHIRGRVANGPNQSTVSGSVTLS